MKSTIKLVLFFLNSSKESTLISKASTTFRRGLVKKYIPESGRVKKFKQLTIKIS